MPVITETETTPVADPCLLLSFDLSLKTAFVGATRNFVTPGPMM